MADPITRLNAALEGRYTVERELGEGGMATVYLAEDVRHDRKVALKVLKPELSAVLGAERFLAEIKTTANLQHPHILPLFDSGQADEFLFYVMPYVEGESLQEKLDREKQLGVRDSLAIAQKVADALDYAHEQGVVHRDIKPANILLSGRGEPVVADFGIALAVAQARGTSRMTESGVVIGTTDYMSPEQASGEGEIDGRNDIYSLGCMLYEMLVGQPPFTGPTTESILVQHLSADPRLVNTIRSNVPPEVAAAIHRTLQKTPADRFATAGEFARELELAAARVRVSGPAASTVTTPADPTSLIPSGWPVRPAYVAVAVAAVLVGVFIFSSLNTPATVGGDEIRLTVIPFENLGADDQEYFAVGMADEITVRLAGVDGLTIIARHSATEYTASPKTPQEIGRELGVDYLLRSTVSWEQSDDGSSTVRLRPLLVRTADGSTEWGESYQEALTGVFEVQARIAEEVVRALGVELLGPELQALEAEPTDDLDAYDFYLRGNEPFRRTVSEADLRLAEDQYGRALALDSDFALASARLSIVHSRMYWYYFDRTEERLERAQQAANRALAVAPDLPEAHLAMGEFYYRGHLDYDRALEEFDLARRQQPDDSELLLNIGSVKRRQGNWSEADDFFRRASELEPRRASNAVQAGITHVYVRDYPEAARYLEKAISVAPEQLRPRVWMAYSLVAAAGDTAGARAQLDEGGFMNPRELDPRAWIHWALFRVLEGASDDNLRRVQELRVEADSAFVYLATAELYGLREDVDRVLAYYDSARVVLEDRLSALPDEPAFHSELGVAYAGLGRGEDAIREGQIATRLQPLSREAVSGPVWAVNLARIYTMLDMPDEAVEQLQVLLSGSSALSAHWLRLDPKWAALRGHAGFERLVASSAVSN